MGGKISSIKSTHVGHIFCSILKKKCVTSRRWSETGLSVRDAWKTPNKLVWLYYYYAFQEKREATTKKKTDARNDCTYCCEKEKSKQKLQINWCGFIITTNSKKKEKRQQRGKRTPEMIDVLL